MPYAPKSLYTPRYADNIAQLLTRQGDIAAAGAARSGEIWGNTVNQLGQIAGQAIQGYAAQKEQEKQQKAAEQRQMTFEEAVGTFDPTKPMDTYRKLAVAVGPQAALEFTKGVVSLQNLQKPEANVEDFKQTVDALWRTKQMFGPEYLAQKWPELAPILQKGADKFLPGADLSQFTPEILKGLDQLHEEFNPTKAAKPEPGFELSPGQTRFDASGKPIASLPAKPAQTLAEIQAEAAARARGTASARPSEAPAEYTLNPEGVVLSSYGVKQKNEVRKQAMERGLPVFENAATQTKGVVLAGIVADAKELTDLLALPEVQSAVGPVAGRWAQLKGSLTSLDPDVRRALQLMTSLSDTELRKRSGAQINEKEMQRLLRFTTDPNKPLDHNTAAVSGLLKAGARDYKALSGLDIGIAEASGTNEEPPDAR
jgi:hypothetical protein